MNAPATLQQIRAVDITGFEQLQGWDLIRKLVAFDTTSRESNLALIDWVQGYLGRFGIEAKLTFDVGVIRGGTALNIVPRGLSDRVCVA